MTRTPGFVDIDLDLTEEEHELAEARARIFGFDVPTFFRVRALTSDGLPEPVAFMAIVGRLQNFAGDYRAHMHAIADRQPGLDRQSEILTAAFAQLLQDWDALYGPR